MCVFFFSKSNINMFVYFSSQNRCLLFYLTTENMQHTNMLAHRCVCMVKVEISRCAYTFYNHFFFPSLNTLWHITLWLCLCGMGGFMCMCMCLRSNTKWQKSSRAANTTRNTTLMSFLKFQFEFVQTWVTFGVIDGFDCAI